MSTYTTNLGFIIQTPGDPAVKNQWGANLNVGLIAIADTAIAGLLSLNVAGSSDVILTYILGAADQSRNPTIVLSGLLTGNIKIFWPQTVTRKMTVINNTTGAFTVTLAVNNGSGSPAGATIGLAQGNTGVFISNGTDILSGANSLGTRQVLTTGSGATYTTPQGARQLRIRMWGGGGGGGGSAYGAHDSGNGSDGTDTSFNGVAAKAGKGGNFGAGGNTGSASGASLRQAGPSGSFGGATVTSPTNITGVGGAGGGEGGGQPSIGAGNSAVTNSGGGGGAAGFGDAPFAANDIRTGGGAGEYAEIIINNPAATYTYTVGGGGAGGVAGTGGATGGAGGSGVIIVDEDY